MKTRPSDALDEARKAFRDQNYARALECYEYFFDHALEDDQHNYYGVRLSYCLSEWAELGAEHPAALQRLRERADEALALLAQTREPERFHDFSAMCEYLQRPEEPVRHFLRLHASDPVLATSIVRFIWDDLVEHRHWSVCKAYLGEPLARYAAALRKFDRTMAICNDNPSFGGKEFEEQIEGWYVCDVSNLLLVLKNTGRAADETMIEHRMASDMKSRNREPLAQRVHERVCG